MGGWGDDEQRRRARMTSGSSPTLRKGSILNFAPWSSPTSSSWFGREPGSGEDLDELKGRAVLRTEVVGRMAARRARVAGRREAIVMWGVAVDN